MCSLNSISSEEAKRQSVKSVGSDSSSSGPGSLLTVDIKNFKAMWNEEVYQNRERWKAQACKGTVYTIRRSNFRILETLMFWVWNWFFNQIHQEWGKLACNALNICHALSCLYSEGFSLTCICQGFYVLHVWLCAHFFSSSVYSYNKFWLILFRHPLYESVVSKQMKPIPIFVVFLNRFSKHLVYVNNHFLRIKVHIVNKCLIFSISFRIGTVYISNHNIF